MKHLFFFSFIIAHLTFGNVNSIVTNSLTFVNNGKTDFSEIFVKSENLKIIIKDLFNKDLLDHEFTRAYNIEANFEFYWSKNKNNWNFLDLNNDKINEIIYLSNPSGKPDEYSISEIYVKNHHQLKLIYKESGAIFAYKIHPNTKEIILFHQRFPCCSSKSNNVNMIRVINGKIKLRKKYFIANSEILKSNCIPKLVHYDLNFSYLTKESELRWSSDKPSKKNINLVNDNIIAFYPCKAPYKVLYSNKKWDYVLFYEAPVKSKKNKFAINPYNFSDIHVYGWIEKER